MSSSSMREARFSTRRGEAADEVDADRRRQLHPSPCQVQDELAVGPLGDPGDGRHRDAPVDDGHAGLGGDGVGHRDERRRPWPVTRRTRSSGVRHATQVDAERDGADVEMVAPDHARRSRGSRPCPASRGPSLVLPGPRATLRGRVGVPARCGAWPRTRSRGARRSPCRSPRPLGPGPRRARRSRPCRACPRPGP